MNNRRHELSKNIDKNLFLKGYYLKEELIEFCKQNNFPSSGSKSMLTERIAEYLETGKIIKPIKVIKSKETTHPIEIQTTIEKGIKCTEKHREFFVNILEKISNSIQSFKHG